MREVDHLRRLVDEHERERERAVDRAVRKSRRECLEEGLHQYPRYAVRTASFDFSSRCAARHRDAARLEDVAALRGRERDGGVLLDHEYGEPFLPVQLGHNPEDLARDDGREAERRLVEHQQSRPRQERAREREHLLLAARQRPRLLVSPLLEPGEVAEHRREVGPPEHVAAHAQVLPDGQFGEDAATFGDVRDPGSRHCLRRRPAEPLAAEHDVTGPAHGSGDGAERGRLAGSVGAEERDDLAVGDRQRHAVQRDDLSVPCRDVGKLEQRRHEPR